MEEMIKVAVDAMGGDYAPSEAIKGAVAAVNEKENVEVFLVGKQEILERELSSCTCLLYTSPSPRDRQKSRMPSSA